MEMVGWNAFTSLSWSTLRMRGLARPTPAIHLPHIPVAEWECHRQAVGAGVGAEGRQHTIDDMCWGGGA